MHCSIIQRSKAPGVIGVHNLAHGENVRAYVELKPDVPRPTAAELIAFARTHVGYKAPEEIVFVDATPPARSIAKR
jgi:long-chain acyl-CoA synthetase